MKDFMRSGASAYISKSSEAATYINVMLTVYEHGEYLSDEQLEALAHDDLHAQESFPSLKSLTYAENKILPLFCEGKAAKEIAGILSITVNTVNTHWKNIKRKTKTKSRIELVKYGVKNGLIRL